MYLFTMLSARRRTTVARRLQQLGCSVQAHGAGGETADLRHLSNESIKNYEFIFAGSNLHLPSL